jgi:ABC-type multidrug transport system fused ATPase/permease subunit
MDRGDIVGALAGRLLAEVRPSPALGALASLAVASAAQLGLALLARAWVDGPVMGGRLGEAPGLLGRSAGLLVVLAVASGLGRWLTALTAQDLQLRLRASFQMQLLRARLGFVRQHPAGDLVTRLTADVGALGGLCGALLRAPGDLLLVAGALSAMLWLDARVALLGLLVVAPVAVLADRGSRHVRRRTARARQTLGACAALFQEQLRGLTTIRLHRAEADQERRAASALDAHRRAAVAAQGAAALLVAGVFAVTGAGLLALVLQTSHGLIGGAASPGAVVALLLCAAQLVDPLRRLGESAATFSAALAAGSRVVEVLEAPPEPADTAGRRLPAPVLRLEDVRFRHRPGEPLLEGVDLEVRPGQPLGLVGPSGAGKSTLLGLLPRLVELQGGRLELDRVDVRELDLPSLRRTVCLLDDAPFVFAGSLLDNLRYGSPGASREETLDAARRVGLSGLLEERGADTLLQEAGRDLSGGQKQRLALARAVLRDPGLLLLDEATSALDGATEAAVLDGLRDWLDERTVVIVAHRLATVARLPRLALLEHGRVTACGTLAELGASCPPLVALFGSQWRR